LAEVIFGNITYPTIGPWKNESNQDFKKNK
jgi:hypothetical protein